MSVIHLDIETVPRQDLSPDPEMVKVPSTYKDPVKIQAYKEANADSAYRKLSLSKTGAQIITIACAYNDGPISSFFGDEKDIMKQFDTWLNDIPTKTPLYAWSVAGHNIATFDIPILWLRTAKYKLLKIKELLPTKPFDDRIRDSMRDFAPTTRNEYVSMDVLCEFFGLEGKGDMDGSMVYDTFLDGDIEKVAKYCAEDVKKARMIHDILQFKDKPL